MTNLNESQMGEYKVYVRPEKQSWCLVLPGGRRYIGQYNPFTDSNLTKVLDELGDQWRQCGFIAMWLMAIFKEEGIIDGTPKMIDADRNSFKKIATEPMMRINKVLQKLVDTHCNNI